MPKAMDGNFYGINFAGINIDKQVLDNLQDIFIKFLPDDAPGDYADRLEPPYMKAKFEKLGIDKQNPALYAMVCWMAQEYVDAGL